MITATRHRIFVTTDWLALDLSLGIITPTRQLRHSPPCMHRTLSSMHAASGSQLKSEFSRVHAHRPLRSPSRSMHSIRNPNSALMSAACAAHKRVGN